ncbi:MAG: TIGR02253 family HAD-type hydrolase [Promethearchaeota archaeon]|nr:MAG: TIGR02253 family HAD-type hydrolase [Candidatus Lokiarchaeota archaeon]
MIHLIGFDLDDTLFNASELATQARIGGLKKIQECGLNFSLQEGINGLFDIVKEFGSNYTHHYDTLLERMKKDPVKYEITIPDFKIPKYVAAGIMGYHEVKVKNIKPFEDVLGCLVTLKKIGYPMILISDGRPIKQYEKLHRLKIEQFFTDIFISEEIGLQKPNPEYFKYCLNEMDVLPSEFMYVGDRMDHDIKPAKDIGINTVLIHRKGKYDPIISGKSYPYQADYEISSLEDLLPIVKSIS